MTVGINIQPFLACMTQLRDLTSGQGGLINANDFLQAGLNLHSALSPANVPGMSQERRDGILAMFQQVVADGEKDGQLLKLPIRMFLIQDLRGAGVFPDKAVLENREALIAFLESLAATSEERVAQSAETGGIHVHRDPRETVLGLDDFGDTMVVGALKQDGFHIGRPARTLLSSSIPAADDDFDRRVTQQRYGSAKPLTAQPIVDVSIQPADESPASVEAAEETAQPLDSPPDRLNWTGAWQAYRKGELSLGDFLKRYRKGEVPLDFMRDALQGEAIPFADFVGQVAQGHLSVDDFLGLFFECAFPLEPLASAIREGKVPLLTSGRAAVEEQLAQLAPFSGGNSLSSFLKRAREGEIDLSVIRTALQEGIIPYRDLVAEVADGSLSPEDFLTTFSEGSLPAQPILLGLRSGKIPAVILTEALQDAVRNGHIAVEPLLEAMQEGVLPLVDGASGHLLIQKPIYLNRTGQAAPSIVVSDYKLDLNHLLGAGGTGEVYLGIEEDTQREVAIKIVKNKLKQERVYEGFKEEIRHAPFSDSPRFVKIYATGLTSQDEPFAVMELLRGGALSDFISKQSSGLEPFDFSKAMKLACQVVAAAAEMHEHGYIHRDIKTENYFLDDKGNAKLGDQGLRKNLADYANEPPENGLWGTPGTMPPEKLRMEARDSEVTDVFALGVVLYEIFTGKFCFSGNTAMALMHSVCNVDPAKPSEVGRSLPSARDLPESLDDIVMKCLEKDPARRYPSAKELLYDLVTVHAQQLEREANESLRHSRHTGADDQINEDIWQEKIQMAIQELHTVYSQFQDPRIRRKLVELNYSLYVWADRVGNEKELSKTHENILKLEPHSEEAREVKRNNFIKVNFQIEGSRPPGSSIGVRIKHYEHRAGYFEQDPTTRKNFSKSDLPRRELPLERGGVYTAQFNVDGMVSFVRDIPVRPGDYSLRIPFYSRSEIPEGWILIPAGPTAARSSIGSFAEQFDDWREVNNDYAMGPLVTNDDWFNFLKALAGIDKDIVQSFMPRHWDFNFLDGKTHRDRNYRTADGQFIVGKEPVTYVTRAQSLKYLEYLEGVLRRQGLNFLNEGNGPQVRFPTLFEWRRAFRPDPREWPHGDSTPRVGDIAIRRRDRRAAGPIKLLPIDAPVRDASPFNVEDGLNPGEAPRVVKHVVGNVQKFLHIGGQEDHTRITRALGLKNGQLGTAIMATAGADCSMSPSDADILNQHPLDACGLIGILPVIELRKAPSSPSITSLTRLARR